MKTWILDTIADYRHAIREELRELAEEWRATWAPASPPGVVYYTAGEEDTP